MLLAMATCSAKDILHLKSQKDIDAAIKNNNMVVIDYHAEKTCAPCQQMAKILPDLAKEFEKVQFIKVDVNEFDVAEIRSVPTFVFYLDGKEVKRFAGSKSKGSFINIMKESFKCC
jgi:thiol-disulfide isomerase/thioredoxin